MDTKKATFEDLMNHNGYEVIQIAGELRYVTRDNNGRATVGPRRRGGKGIMAMLHRRNHARPSAPAQKAVQATIETSTGSPVGIDMPPARIRDAVKDPEWHRTVRHLAIDVAMWATCGSLAAVVLKAAWFVVTL